MAGTDVGDMHRIGGSSVENLRSKTREATLDPPDISLLHAPSPGVAARQRQAFPAADGLHEATEVTVDDGGHLRGVGFDVSRSDEELPDHDRLIHPDGVAGFSDANLARLSAVFMETPGHGS